MKMELVGPGNMLGQSSRHSTHENLKQNLLRSQMLRNGNVGSLRHHQ